MYQKMLEIMDLKGNGKIAGFSKGMQRQTGLLLALSTQPDHLFLDETFDGLDVTRRMIMTRILKKYTEVRQAVIVVTSHYLQELEKIVDEVGMIEDECLVAPDTGGGSLEDYFVEKGAFNEEAVEELFA